MKCCMRNEFERKSFDLSSHKSNNETMEEIAVVKVDDMISKIHGIIIGVKVVCELRGDDVD